MPTVSARLRLTIAAGALAAVIGGLFLVSSAPAQVERPQTTTRTPEQERGIALRKQDMSNLKQIGYALFQYEQEHTYHLPKAANWMDAISPYLKDKSVLFDPFHPGRYGYAYNRNCSEKSIAAIASPAETVAVFSSSLGVRNASDTGESLSSVGYALGADRHGSDILFVDTHVKWMFTSALRSSFSIQSGRMPSFATKMPLARLIRERDQARASLPKLRSMLQNDTQNFEAELHALLPEASTQNIAGVRSTEMIIGNMENMRSTKEERKTVRRYQASSADPHRLTLAVLRHSDALVISHLKNLRQQETALLPGVPASRLARLHILARAVASRQFVVPSIERAISEADKEIEYRQSHNSAQ